MSRRLLVAAAVALLGFSPSPALAQDTATEPLRIDTSPTFISTLGTSVRLAEFGPEDLEQVQTPFSPVSPRGTGPALAGLFASTVVMQALDAHSTLTALDAGAMEGNPIMAGVVKNRFAFIGVKAAVAAGTIYATREMAKKNKVAAIITLVAINSVYAYVAHHNYKVARGLR